MESPLSQFPDFRSSQRTVGDGELLGHEGLREPVRDEESAAGAPEAGGIPAGKGRADLGSERGAVLFTNPLGMATWQCAPIYLLSTHQSMKRDGEDTPGCS